MAHNFVLAKNGYRKLFVYWLEILQDCDEFTRNFLKKLGVRVPTPDETPEDPFNKRRGEVNS